MNNQRNSKYDWLILGVLLIAVNAFASFWPYRLDLTSEKRYTLSTPVKKMLKKLPGDIHIDIFLQGNLKAGIRKLRNSTEELLQEFDEYAGGKIHYRFVDPLAGADDSAKALIMDSLARLGIQPMTQIAQSKKGEEQSQRILLPAGIVQYDGKIFPVDLLKGVQRSREGQPEEQLYLNAETLLEYKFANAIDKITKDSLPSVGYVLGNGEPLDFKVYDLIQFLRSSYRFGILRLDSVPFIPPQLDALIIVKPTEKFNEAEKRKLDQFVMRGGRLIWMVDNLNAEPDSLHMNRETIAYDRGLNLEDLFFKYGVRVNQDLVEDMQCASINLVVGTEGGKPQFQLLPWPYYPLLDGTSLSPVSKNLDPVYARFPNSIDTVKAPGIRKTTLLQSSPNARTVSTPALISFESIKLASDPKAFNRSAIPVAVLLEGRFSSLYANRISSALADSFANLYHQPFLPVAEKESKIIVCANAEVVMNEVMERGPLPLGMNKDINYTFANQDFLSNSIDYLVNPSGILETRSKDFTLRLLDPEKTEEEKTAWQFVNIVLPLLVIIGSGAVFQYIRKRRYRS
jgi:ABC-2 type transport system permease protein